jgi:4'-phosphopantetheinyl transferase
LLSVDELERAARFAFERDRRRFVVARATLRSILAAYIRCAPSALKFEQEPFGRPRLAHSDVSPGLDFNLAHSHEVAVFAVGRGRRVGIDVEYVRSMDDLSGVARTAFSPAERARLAALPPGEQVPAFFDCWTCKEAYLKARGDGLSAPLQAFDMRLDDSNAPALGAHRLDPLEVGRWWLQRLAIAPGYAAALCAERPSTNVNVRAWF